MDRTLLIAVLLLAPAALVATTVAAAADDAVAPIQGVVGSDQPVTIDGDATTTFDAGIVHLWSESMSKATVELEAEHISLTTTWRRGYVYEGGQGPLADRHEVYTDADRDFHSFVDARMSMTPYQPGIQALAIGEDGRSHIVHESIGSVTLAPMYGKEITKAGIDDEGQSAGNAPNPSFWYRVDDAWVGELGGDTATVTGDFTLFINNVTFEIESADGDYQNWTGYRSWTVVGDAREYDARVTVLEVTGGSLHMTAPNAIDAIAPHLPVEMNGTIRAEEVRGELRTPTALYGYDPAPLYLRGTGTMDLSSTLPANRGASDTVAPASLNLAPEGAFEIVQTEGLQASALETEGHLGQLPGALTGAGIAVLAMLLVAVPVTLKRRSDRGTPSPGSQERKIETTATAPRCAEARARRRRFVERLEAAEELYENMDFENAREILEALSCEFPDMPQPWANLGDTLIELGRYDEAAEAYLRFGEAMETPEPDALTKQVKALALADRPDEAIERLVKLSAVDPASCAHAIMRHTLVNEVAIRCIPQLHTDLLDAWTRAAWRKGQRQVASEIFCHLAQRRPKVTVHYVLDENLCRLCSAVLPELDAESLEAIVEVAWQADRLELAATAMVQLAALEPKRARELVQDPVYAPLGDDLRIARVVE